MHLTSLLRRALKPAPNVTTHCHQSQANPGHGAQGINLAVESLAAALARVRGEVGGPHAALRTQTAQLANLHGALDLLRHLIHRRKLVAKLRVRARAAQAPGSRV